MTQRGRLTHHFLGTRTNTVAHLIQGHQQHSQEGHDAGESQSPDPADHSTTLERCGMETWIARRLTLKS